LLRRQARKYRLARRLRLLRPASTLRLQRRIFVLAASAGLVIAGNSDLTGRSLRRGWTGWRRRKGPNCQPPSNRSLTPESGTEIFDADGSVRTAVPPLRA
jgi:hypothetical protein